MRRVLSWIGGRTKLQLGVMWLVVTLLAGAVLMNKQNLLLSMRRGDTITAEFSSRYKLAPVVSKVEVAGVKVGQITAVRELDGGGAAIEMKLDTGTLDALGSKPRAATLLQDSLSSKETSSSSSPRMTVRGASRGRSVLGV